MGLDSIFLTFGGDKSNVKENISWLSWNCKSKITSTSFKDFEMFELCHDLQLQTELEAIDDKISVPQIHKK